MEIKYRSAKKEDSYYLAELTNIASSGVVDFLFHDLVPGADPVQAVAYSLENDNYPHSYKSAFVAEHNRRVVGMALSYPASYHGITEEMRSFFPEERLEHLKDFYAARIENSWYIDSLGVSEEYRKRGIGRHLIALTKERAMDNGYSELSLISFADNTSALSLYKDVGFDVVGKITLHGNEFIPHQGGCVLMQWDINSPSST
jgi:ribosomal protein S18 acetylase RimI-like enzyme